MFSMTMKMGMCDYSPKVTTQMCFISLTPQQFADGNIFNICHIYDFVYSYV